VPEIRRLPLECHSPARKILSAVQGFLWKGGWSIWGYNHAAQDFLHLSAFRQLIHQLIQIPNLLRQRM
jgi:hypothetical protein